MTRRMALLLGLAGCTAPPPLPARREWVLSPQRPVQYTFDPRGPILQILPMQGGGRATQRGLVTVRPDGGADISATDEYSILPSEMLNTALSDWFAASGRLSAIITGNSPGLAPCQLETQLTELYASLVTREAVVSIGVTLRDVHSVPHRDLVQRLITGRAPLAVDAQGRSTPQAEIEAISTAAGDAFARIEAIVMQAMPRFSSSPDQDN